jgi:peptidoglycan-associated lipoprotein
LLWRGDGFNKFPVKGEMNMRMKILSVLAVVALVSACETASEEKAMSSGSGASQGSAATTAAPMAKEATGIMPGSQQDLVVNVGDRVFFDFDKFNVRPDQRSTLDKQVAWMKANPSVTVVVEGHCDERGTREYNLALGERRANAVKDYMAASGVNPERIQVISYGKERPVALGSTEEAWSQNRRGVTKVSGAGS